MLDVHTIIRLFILGTEEERAAVLKANISSTVANIYDRADEVCYQKLHYPYYYYFQISD